ncbi:hypothetical protein EA187_00615 [Lujinxingia sediminis]|uniref:Uncharacterized protein n=2 Tax=Lujinxingia sediminis TaxID=2480984 RepID=A0ABY0CX28_9DELT|nr:hypothetical protein EA187_00615 [Lujinxingia sediminis]
MTDEVVTQLLTRDSEAKPVDHTTPTAVDEVPPEAPESLDAPETAPASTVSTDDALATIGEYHAAEDAPDDEHGSRSPLDDATLSPEAPEANEPDEDAPSIFDDSAAPSRPPEDRVRVRCYRIREGWQILTGGEIAATLGPPGVFIGGLAILCILSLFDITQNPLRVHPWAQPAAFAALGLLGILPLVRAWRPMWHGARFRIIARGEVEEEADLRATNARLILDRTSWPIAELRRVELNRWESPEDLTLGWVLTIDPPYHAPVHLMTFDPEPEVWRASRVPRIDCPEDAWQLPPAEFDAIHTTLIEHRTQSDASA